MPKRIYQAIPKFEKELQQEILLRQEAILEKWGPLYLVQSSSERQSLHWVQNIWENAEVVPVESIQKAAQMLKSLHPLWAHFPLENIRRGELVSQALPRIKAKPLQFLESRQLPPLGHFSFLSKDQMLLGYPCRSLFPCGVHAFEEDHKNPPSRAYLKLWELLTLHLPNHRPGAEDRVLDLGACPGGWTWVLSSMVKNIVAIDGAPLAESIMKNPKVQFLKKDAFQLKPQELGNFDWLFSDMICDPRRLYQLVSAWRDSGLVKNFVCTLKFKGSTDFEIIQKFSEIPGSQILHLFHNKHELTWICLKN